MGLKLLCVCAHPDDECFGFGGALALAASQGVETRVICFTDGQAATHRGDSSDSEDLGRMRREEFTASCNTLGVTHHELLDFQDAHLEFADFTLAAARIVRVLRDFHPNVVLTFGLDGGLNTHPDHTMVAAFTTAAFHWAASEKRFPDLGPTHHADRLFHLSTTFFLEDRPASMPSPWTLNFDISSVLDRKRRAIEQHTSQAPLMEQTKDIFDRFGNTEAYTLMATRDPQPATLSTSMFEGIPPS